MRELATRDRLIEFMNALGGEADTESRVYLSVKRENKSNRLATSWPETGTVLAS